MGRPLYSFHRVVWGNSIYFFNELDVYVNAKSGFFDIIALSTGKSTRFSIKYAINFIGSTKCKSLFFLSPILSRSLVSQTKCYLYALNLADLTFRKITMPIQHEFNSMFLSEDESHLVLIHSNGQVFNVSTSDLRVEMILSMEDFELRGCHTHDGRLYLSRAWQNIGSGIFEYPIYLNPRDFFRIRLDLVDGDVHCIPMCPSNDYKNQIGFDSFSYNRKHGIWAFCSRSSNDLTKNHHKNWLECEFIKDDRLLFELKVPVTKIRNGILKPAGDRYMLVYSYSDSFLYLVDLVSEEVKYLEILGKEIMDVFVNEYEGYLIPTFLQGSSGKVYFIDDFKTS